MAGLKRTFFKISYSLTYRNNCTVSRLCAAWMLQGNKCCVYWPPCPGLSVSPARGRGRDALSCGGAQGDTAHQSLGVEIEAASRWGLGGRQLPKEVLSINIYAV